MTRANMEDELCSGDYCDGWCGVRYGENVEWNGASREEYCGGEGFKDIDPSRHNSFA